MLFSLLPQDWLGSPAMGWTRYERLYRHNQQKGEKEVRSSWSKAPRGICTWSPHVRDMLSRLWFGFLHARLLGGFWSFLDRRIPHCTRLLMYWWVEWRETTDFQYNYRIRAKSAPWYWNTYPRQWVTSSLRFHCCESLLPDFFVSQSLPTTQALGFLLWWKSITLVISSCQRVALARVVGITEYWLTGGTQRGTLAAESRTKSIIERIGSKVELRRIGSYTI